VVANRSWLLSPPMAGPAYHDLFGWVSTVVCAAVSSEMSLRTPWASGGEGWPPLITPPVTRVGRGCGRGECCCLLVNGSDTVDRPTDFESEGSTKIVPMPFDASSSTAARQGDAATSCRAGRVIAPRTDDGPIRIPLAPACGPTPVFIWVGATMRPA